MSKAVKKLKKVIIVAAVAVATIYTGGAVAYAMGAALGATGAVATSVIAIASKVVVGAVIGGIASKLQGGSFKDGAVLGAVTGGLMEVGAQLLAASGTMTAAQTAVKAGAEGGMETVGQMAKDSFTSMVDSGKGLLNKITGGEPTPGLAQEGIQAAASDSPFYEGLPGEGMPGGVDLGGAARSTVPDYNAADFRTGANYNDQLAGNEFELGATPPPDAGPSVAKQVADGSYGGVGQQMADNAGAAGKPTGIMGLLNETMGKNTTASLLGELGKLGVSAFENPAETEMDKAKALLWYQQQRWKNYGMPEGWQPPNTWGVA